MKRTITMAISAFCALLICQAYCVEPVIVINGTGQIFITEKLRVNQFGFRIADIMVDVWPPDMNTQSHANVWQNALNDLVAASPNGEITHVQMRTFWKLPEIPGYVDPNTGAQAPDLSDPSKWNNPSEGAYDIQNLPHGQVGMAANWKSWIFGDPAPTYTCAAKRIHDAGLKLEFCLGAAWTGNDTMAGAIPVFHDQPEANYPPFNGEAFLTNYRNNVLRPVAEFLASNPNFLSGDIFMLSFEMCYSYCDFAWSHNETWKSMIQTVRDIFRAAGKSVPLTIDNNSWYDDFGLGYDAVKLLNPSASIDSEWRGISGASYLKDLDFISLSFWPQLLSEGDIPTTWNDTHIDTLVVPAWSNCSVWYKVGTGYGLIPGQWGRNLLADLQALSKVMDDTKVLLNTGWQSGHSILASSNPAASGGGSFDNMAQKVAWEGQIRALWNNSWCAGQDFERYCEDKQSSTTVDTSWRNSPAQAGIIQEIRTALNQL